MSQKTESAHAATLRDLGFSPVDPKVIEQIRSVLVRLTGLQFRAKQHQTPTFTRGKVSTIATDDLGQQWTGPPDMDLSPFGFARMETKTSQGLTLH